MPSSRARAVTVDLYSRLSHKTLVGDPDSAPSVGAPTWCPASEARRIRAYLARAAYLGNTARELLPLPKPGQPDPAKDHREYGDPSYIVDRIVAAVLGDDWTWIVEGADEDLPDEPDLPPEPEDPDDDATDLQKRIHASRLARWTADAEAIVDQWEADWAAQPALRTRQSEYRAWVERATIDQRVHETEHDTAGLGDSVIVLWHQANDWPRPEIIPPEAYFPVRDEHDDGAFPRKVHLAWEYDHDIPDDRGGITTERRLRRITFELALITDLRAAGEGDGRGWVGPDGEAIEGPMLRRDESVVVEDGKQYVVRTYPWDRPAPTDPDDTTSDGVDLAKRTPNLTETAADREPSRFVCLYSDGTWPMDEVGNGVYALDDSKATWRPYGDGVAYRADYGIDFLPVIHTPNTPTGKEHWGRAVIDVVLQVLDDLSGADTAAAGASRYLQHPTVGLKGDKVLPEGQAPIMMPGRIFNGDMTVLDLSKGLEKLMDYVESLQGRVGQNTTLPADLLGRVGEGGGQESGFSRLIRWAPFAQTIGALRMTRKWPLFGKMAQRMAQVQGRWDGATWVPVLPPGPTPTVRLAFGSFLPTDRAETLKDVAAGLQAHAISLQTAVAYLVAGGWPIDDARAEIDRIRADMTESAKALADATGSEVAAAEYLGIDLPETVGGEPPVLDLTSG